MQQLQAGPGRATWHSCPRHSRTPAGAARRRCSWAERNDAGRGAAITPRLGSMQRTRWACVGALRRRSSTRVPRP